MKINVYNVKENIISIIALTGQIEKEYLYNCLPYNIDYIKRIISELIDEKYIKEVLEKTIRKMFTEQEQMQKGSITYYRLKKKGVEAAEKINSNLKSHYMNITRNGKFSGPTAQVIRLRKLSDLIAYLLSTDVIIDMVEIERNETHFLTSESIKQIREKEQEKEKSKDIFNEEGELVPYDELLNNIEPKKKYFFSSKASRQMTSPITISGKRGEKDNTRKNMYRIYGFLVGNENMYPLYILSGNDMQWIPGVEKQMKTNLTNEIKRRWGTKTLEYKNELHPEGEAIFYYDEFLNMKEFIIHKRKKRGQTINPLDVYSDAYLLPFGKYNSELIRQLLTSYRWEKRLMESIFEEEEIEYGKHFGADAIMNTLPTWELLSCNYRKMKEAYKSSKEREIMLIIHRWQEKELETIFNKNTYFIKITDENFKKIVKEELLNN